MTSPEAQESLTHYIEVRQLWLADAVELVTGSREGNPLDVFPQSTEVRRDAPGLDLTEEQESSFREIAGRFGIGGEMDVTSAAECHVLEGGLAWKIEAEAANISSAREIVFSGWPGRIIGQPEVEHIQRKF